MSENGGENGNGSENLSHANGSSPKGHRYKPGQSGNPTGRLPKKLDRDYHRAAKRAVSNRAFLEICKRALAEAMAPPGLHPIAVAKARDFLLKALSHEQSIKVEVSGSLDSHVQERRLVLDAADVETRGLVAVLANRLYGPKATPPTNGNGHGGAS